MIPYILTALGGYLIGSSVKQYADGGQIYQFEYNCVNPNSDDELEFILDNMKQISADEFLKNVTLEEVNNALMYGINYESKKRLKSDYSVSFYKIKKKGIDAYIFVNSAIEYVFKKSNYADGGQVQLLAPNGKPSNLTPDQYKLVRTPEFKAWFGDWENNPENASKVVDDNGEPMVLWHGGKQKINIFKIPSHFGTLPAAMERVNDIALWKPSFKSDYYECFLNIRKIYKTIDVGIKKNWAIEMRIAKSENCDGIKYKNLHEDRKSYSYVVFNPAQIKLANGKNTTFDGSNPDIRYNKGGRA
jgi:hypothetical protein